MEPKQLEPAPNSIPTLPPQPITTPAPTIVPQSKPSKLSLILLSLVSLLSLSGLVYFYLQSNLLKQQLDTQSSQAQPPSPTITTQPSPTNDPTTSWQSYQIKELGISFRYPPSLQPMDYPNGPETSGETGKQLCLAFIPITTGFHLVKPVHAGGGACQGILAIGSTSTDYQAGREGGFGDIQGYVKSGDGYKANFVLGKQYDLPPNLVNEITNPQNVKVLKIVGQNTTQFAERGPEPLPGTPGEGYLGAIININNSPYAGFNIQMKLSSNLTLETFDQILSTVKFSDSQ